MLVLHKICGSISNLSAGGCIIYWLVDRFQVLNSMFRVYIYLACNKPSKESKKSVYAIDFFRCRQLYLPKVYVYFSLCSLIYITQTSQIATNKQLDTLPHIKFAATIILLCVVICRQFAYVRIFITHLNSFPHIFV